MLIDFRARGREGERNIDWLLLIHTPTRERARSLDMCPDQE